MLPVMRRLPTVRQLIDRQSYFVLHALRQVGKTTSLMALGRELTREGRYASVLVSMEVGAPFSHDVGAAELAILSEWRLGSAPYHEIAPHLVLMAFLHRVVNGHGTIQREYAVGSGRMDLLVRHGPDTMAMELPRRCTKLDDTSAWCPRRCVSSRLRYGSRANRRCGAFRNRPRCSSGPGYGAAAPGSAASEGRAGGVSSDRVGGRCCARRHRPYSASTAFARASAHAW
jgi:hypothetical protein